MCGFTLLLGYDPTTTPLSYYNATSERGRDTTHVVHLQTLNATLVFHRLAIVGTQEISGEQPITKHNCILLCNGEIYNHTELVSSLDNIIYHPQGTSDCEVLLDLYHYHKSLDFLPIVDGVYSFVLIDVSNKLICFGRDSYGVRPSYISKCGNAISSTLHGIPRTLRKDCIQIPSGTHGMYAIGCPPVFERWTRAKLCKTERFPKHNAKRYVEKSLQYVKRYFTRAVNKRVQHIDKDCQIGCLLSGGLDSSIVAALVVRKHCENGGKASDIQTFSIGLDGSPDVAYASEVAKYLGTTHHEWIYKKKTFIKALEDVIRDTATYDVTTIRASIGNWLVARHIYEKTTVRVVFNGDGADEVCGGYAYMHLAPSLNAFDIECKRLVDNIYLYDGLRSDRCVASHSLEARTPFLDKDFVDMYFKLPVSLRAPGTIKGTRCWTRDDPMRRKMTKWFFRMAFSDSGLLPDKILWRHKEAFSDGVSAHGETWGNTIKKYAHSLVPANIRGVVTPEKAELNLYQSIFMDIYGTSAIDVLPEQWMPQWTTVDDPSARMLCCYEHVKSDMVPTEITATNVVTSIQ